MRWAAGFVLLFATSLTAVEPPPTDGWSTLTTPGFSVRVQGRTPAPDEILAYLNDFWTALQARFQVERKAPPPTDVYVFSNRAKFEDYVKTQQQPTSITGWCHLGNEANFIVTYGRRPDSADTLQTALGHELAHLFIIARVPDARRLPGWLNEGIAACFGEAALSPGGTLTPGLPSRRLFPLQARVKMGDYEKLASLFRIASEDWHAAGRSDQAWSVVHYLSRNEATGGFGALRQYLFAAGSDPDPIGLFARSFKVDLENFERDWKEYVIRLEPDLPRGIGAHQ